MIFDTALLMGTFCPFKCSCIWSCKLNGSAVIYWHVFRPFRHSVGMASMTQVSLKASNGEIFNSRNLCFVTSSLFSEIKSPIVRIPMLASLWLYTDLLLMQIALLFQRTVFKISVANRFCTPLFDTEHSEKYFRHSS